MDMSESTPPKPMSAARGVNGAIFPFIGHVGNDVYLLLPHPVAWLRMTPKQARAIATHLRHAANESSQCESTPPQ